MSTMTYSNSSIKQINNSTETNDQNNYEPLPMLELFPLLSGDENHIILYALASLVRGPLLH